MVRRNPVETRQDHPTSALDRHSQQPQPAPPMDRAALWVILRVSQLACRLGLQDHLLAARDLASGPARQLPGDRRSPPQYRAAARRPSLATLVRTPRTARMLRSADYQGRNRGARVVASFPLPKPT